MDTLKAIVLEIGDEQGSVISDYNLGLIIHQLYKSKKYKRETLSLKKEAATKREYLLYTTKLEQLGVLKPIKGYASRYFKVLGRNLESSEETVCGMDPFCYVSHLSAMEYHGLTNRIPIKMYVSSPSLPKWKEVAERRMKEDLAESYKDYVENGMPSLRKPKIKKIDNKEVHYCNSLHYGAFITVRNVGYRVSSIGRTFLDMLRNPDLCGGIRHVLEVFEETAENYLKLIVDEVDRNGNPIDKVRAGYILEELCQLQDDQIDSWEKYAQQGGSRKLDSAGDYAPVWSEKWKLSLNC